MSTGSGTVGPGLHEWKGLGGDVCEDHCLQLQRDNLVLHWRTAAVRPSMCYMGVK